MGSIVRSLMSERKVKKPKLVYGVGINDSTTPIKRYESVDGKQKMVWTCPAYVNCHMRWLHSNLILGYLKPSSENMQSGELNDYTIGTIVFRV